MSILLELVGELIGLVFQGLFGWFFTKRQARRPATGTQKNGIGAEPEKATPQSR